MRQIRWMEFLKDYDFQLIYHLGKVNVVANFLSQKNIDDLHLFVEYANNCLSYGMITMISGFLDMVKERQLVDLTLGRTRELLELKRRKGNDGVLWYKNKVYPKGPRIEGTYAGRRAQEQIEYTPQNDHDVPRSLKDILVVEHEERNN
ncbi:hypothetical protein CR513_60722, partial [Mucuna pruriens]